jgi:hypothetical protein
VRRTAQAKPSIYGGAGTVGCRLAEIDKGWVCVEISTSILIALRQNQIPEQQTHKIAVLILS